MILFQSLNCRIKTNLIIFLFASITARIQYKTNWACEGNTLKLECEEGQLIHLVRANYGRFSLSICNDGGQTDLSVNCMSYKSFLIMQDRCSQNSNCSVVVTSKMFGDPCPGTSKYLEVQYHCVAAGSSNGVSTTRKPGSSEFDDSVPVESMNDLQGVRPPYDTIVTNLTTTTAKPIPSTASTPSSSHRASVKPTSVPRIPISTRVPPAIDFTPPGVDPIEALFRPSSSSNDGNKRKSNHPLIEGGSGSRIPVPLSIPSSAGRDVTTRASAGASGSVPSSGSMSGPSTRNKPQFKPSPDGPPEWLFQSSSTSSSTSSSSGNGRNREGGSWPRVTDSSSRGSDHDSHQVNNPGGHHRNYHHNHNHNREGSRPSLTPTAPIDGSPPSVDDSNDNHQAPSEAASSDDDDMILMAVALFFIVFFLVLGTFALIYCLLKSDSNRHGKYLRRFPFLHCIFPNIIMTTTSESGSGSSEKSSTSTGSTGSVLINQSSSHVYGSAMSPGFPIVATRIPTQIPSDTMKSGGMSLGVGGNYGYHGSSSLLTTPNHHAHHQLVQQQQQHSGLGANGMAQQSGGGSSSQSNANNVRQVALNVVTPLKHTSNSSSGT